MTRRKPIRRAGTKVRPGPVLTKVVAEHPEHPGRRRDGRTVVAMAKNYAGGAVIARHFHRRAQFIYAISGVMTVITDGGAWVVPPQRALWMPPGIEHEIRTSGDLKMRTLYFEPNTALELSFPRHCKVIEMTVLMRELVLRAVELEASADRRAAPFLNLIRVLVDEAEKPSTYAFHLPLPADRRLAKICSELLADPSLALSLPMWGDRVGASSRTLARKFIKETGGTFAQWRQKARLLASFPKLARGEPIAAVAMDLGYDSPSAFSAMFRRALGAPPIVFMSDDKREIAIS